MKIILEATFHFDGEWDNELKAIAKERYHAIREQYIEITNPAIERLNNLWDRVYPNSNLEDKRQYKYYNEYMAKNFNWITKDVKNNLKGADCLFEGYFDPENEAAFAMRNVKGGTVYCTYREVF